MDALNLMLEAIRAAQSAPSSSDLEAALTLARAAQTSARPSPPANNLVLDLDPAPSLLDTPRAPSPPPASSASASALDWLHASLPSGLVQQALDILQSPSSDDDISESLLELYGFEKIDSVSEAVQRRADIVAAASLALSEAQPVPRPPPLHHHQLPPHLSAPPPRDRTPQAQVLFHTAEELAAAKKAKKAQQRLNRGKNGRGEYDDDGDLDLEEWERIRLESLAQGPGPLVSGKRVSRLASLYKMRANLDLHDSLITASRNGIPTSTSPVEPTEDKSPSVVRRWRCPSEPLERIAT